MTCGSATLRPLSIRSKTRRRKSGHMHVASRFSSSQDHDRFQQLDSTEPGHIRASTNPGALPSVLCRCGSAVTAANDQLRGHVVLRLRSDTPADDPTANASTDNAPSTASRIGDARHEDGSERSREPEERRATTLTKWRCAIARAEIEPDGCSRFGWRVAVAVIALAPSDRVATTVATPSVRAPDIEIGWSTKSGDCARNSKDARGRSRCAPRSGPGLSP